MKFHRLTCPLLLLIQYCSSFVVIQYPFLGRSHLEKKRCASTCRIAASNRVGNKAEIPETQLPLSYSFVDPSGPSPLVLNLGIDSRDKNELVCVRQAVTEQRNEIEFSISRVSCSPNIYLLRNLLSLSECEALINHVKQLNCDDKKNAEVTDGDARNVRSNCTVAWIQNEDSKTSDATTLPRELGRVTGNLLITDEAKSKGWCEPLQVVHYEGQGSRFDLHHDGLGRSLTIIYYLNGVGNTWFPFAQDLKLVQKGEQQPNHVKVESLVEAELKSRDDAVRLVEELSLEPGRDGILAAGVNSTIWKKSILRENCDNHHLEQQHQQQQVVQVQAGDAIAFFNYKTLPNPEIGKDGLLVRDMRSFHAGLPTNPQEGEKWIANHWVHSENYYKGWDTDTHK